MRDYSLFSIMLISKYVGGFPIPSSTPILSDHQPSVLQLSSLLTLKLRSDPTR